jgi:hypothetical protein
MERLQQFAALAASLGAAAPPPSAGPPRTIDELLEQAAECGVHSILDIERTGRRTGFAVAAPLSATATRRAFDSAHPTHEQVEARWADVAETCRPWHCRYLVVFADATPVEYAFIGCSGD